MQTSNSTSPERKQSRFHTVVPTVAAFPVAIVVFGWFFVVVNTFFGVAFLTNPASVIPGLGSVGADQQAAIMLAARNLGQALILAFALLYKNVRILQFVWLMAIIREGLDLVAALVRGSGPSPMVTVVLFSVVLIAEFAAFVYLGAIASGRVSKYGSGVQSAGQ